MAAMKRYVENEQANEQINQIAALVSSGNSDSEIAEHLTRSGAVNLKYAEVHWTPQDVKEIRISFNLAVVGQKFCRRCSNEVKQEAIKCRHCGADLLANESAIPSSSSSTCPFCRTEIPSDATVCRSCGAKKGYTTAQGVVYGEVQTIIFGIALPAVSLLAPLAFFGANAITGVWALIMLVPVAHSIYRLSTGGVWYR